MNIIHETVGFLLAENQGMILIRFNEKLNKICYVEITYLNIF